MKQILVTGGAGYIGSHTVQVLLKSGYRVVVLDNLSTGFREALPDAVEFVQGDIRDQGILNQVFLSQKFEAVIHFAAKLNVKESTEKPLEYYENNTFGLLQLLKAMEKNSVQRLVFSSTAAVFGDLIQDRAIVETDPKKPLNPYGESKLICEKMIEAVAGLGKLQFCILRYFNVAGGSMDGSNGQRTANAYHLIHLGAQAASGKKKSMQIFGTDYPTPDGTCVRDYIHVEDLADVHVLALESLLGGHESTDYNCGYGVGYSVREVVQTVQSVSGADFQVIEAARRPGDPASLIADSKKLKKILGWKPKHQNLKAICKSAIDWEFKYN